MIDPWEVAEGEMLLAGYSLDNISPVEHDRHVWSDGLLTFWIDNGRLPTAEELQDVMFEEWDDPVGHDEAQHVLGLLGA